MQIYVHIPFCLKKCRYCDFLSWAADEETRAVYVGALIREIYASKDIVPAGDEVSSVYVGGGTPSVLESRKIERIFEALYEVFHIADDAEISIEANPGTLSYEKLRAIKNAGANRLSIGLQSADDEELKLLGRIHTYGEFLATYDTARRAGFSNINIDLISAIPGQTLKSWTGTLNKTASLEPEHISAYSLIIEKGTPFYNIYGRGGKAYAGLYPPLPDEDTEREIYEHTEMILKKYGYHRYEISNYAKEGFECRHNTGYWRRGDYLGLGLGASSLLNNVRFHNTEDFSHYLVKSSAPEDIREEIYRLPLEEQIEEFMFLGLRMTRGVSLIDFKKNFDMSLEEVYGETMKKLMRQGLIEKRGDFLMLTCRGIDVSNQVFVEFMDPL